MVKERVHSTWNSLPYKKSPKRMISRMVENTVFWINAIPISSGMSCTIHPQTIVTGTAIDLNKYCRIEFGAYTKAHEKTFSQNSTQSRTEPAICLIPTGNLQGSHWLINLRTRRRIKQRTFTPLPVLTCIIDRVHALTDAEVQNPALDFFDRLGNPIPYGDTPDNDNEDGAGGLTGVEEYNNQTEIPGVATPYQEEIPGVATPEEEEEIPEVEIPEEEDLGTEITGVDQNKEDSGVSNPT